MRPVLVSLGSTLELFYGMLYKRIRKLLNLDNHSIYYREGLEGDNKRKYRLTNEVLIVRESEKESLLKAFNLLDKYSDIFCLEASPRGM